MTGRATLAAGASLAALMVACTPRAREGGFHAADPAAKLYAIHRAGDRRDAGAVPDLIEQLDHDDPAVRMLAIGALERITGERHGYDPSAPPAARRAAIEQWTASAGRPAEPGHPFGRNPD